MASTLKFKGPVTLVLLLASIVGAGAGQVSRQFHRTLAVSLAEAVRLQVDLLDADLRIAYAHDGEVSISVTAQSAFSGNPELLSNRLVIAQSGDRVEVREAPGAESPSPKLVYTIDVPYRTEVHALVGHGKQTITGIMGPVNAEVGGGDVDLSYVSLGVSAQARTGNLSFEVVGGRIEAYTGQGNITCLRAPQGISAETQDGDISLSVVGSSTAIVKSGSGRIDVGGARGVLLLSTSAGDLHVKAAPHQDWQLNSKSGTVRIELPPVSNFDLDAMSDSGDVVVVRDDLDKPTVGDRLLNRKANGGGKRVQVRTKSGRIVVS
jgi:hypothetical protein